MVTAISEAWDDADLSANVSGIGDVSILRHTVNGDAVSDQVLVNIDYKALVPTTFDSLPLDTTNLTRLSDFIFMGVATYRQSDNSNRKTGDSTFTFDTTGGTIRQFVGFTETKFGVGAEDQNFMIQATPDGALGTDVVIPRMGQTVTHYEDDANVDNAFIQNIFNLTGRINSSIFLGFNPSEVLFLGARGQKRGLDDWELSYGFAMSPNVSGLSLGPIVGIVKPGHDFLWILPKKVPGTGGTDTVQKPKSVYVNRVYPFGDLNLLSV